LADGTPLINLVEAIRNGGFFEDMRPRVAVARADRKVCRFRWNPYNEIALFSCGSENNAAAERQGGRADDGEGGRGWTSGKPRQVRREALPVANLRRESVLGVARATRPFAIVLALATARSRGARRHGWRGCVPDIARGMKRRPSRSSPKPRNVTKVLKHAARPTPLAPGLPVGPGTAILPSESHRDHQILYMKADLPKIAGRVPGGVAI
jgi:hypothetical protein